MDYLEHKLETRAGSSQDPNNKDIETLKSQLQICHKKIKMLKDARANESKEY